MKKVQYISPHVEVLVVAVDRSLLADSLKVSDTEVEGGLVKEEMWNDDWDVETGHEIH